MTQYDTTMVGAVSNLALGAGIKLGVNVVNQWLAGKREDRQFIHAREQQQLEAHHAFVAEQAKDPFVKVTRRILFFLLTGTYCFLLIFYAFNPTINYEILVPMTPGGGGIFSFIFGKGESIQFQTVQLSGGLLLYQFQAVIQMIIGFYCVPSKAR